MVFLPFARKKEILKIELCKLCWFLLREQLVSLSPSFDLFDRQKAESSAWNNAIAEHHEKAGPWRLYWITHNNKNITFYNLLSSSLSLSLAFMKHLRDIKRGSNSESAFVPRQRREGNKAKLHREVLSNYISRRRILKGNSFTTISIIERPN